MRWFPTRSLPSWVLCILPQLPWLSPGGARAAVPCWYPAGPKLPTEARLEQEPSCGPRLGWGGPAGSPACATSVYPPRFAYKDEYEKFKLYLTIILLLGAVACRFVLHYR